MKQFIYLNISLFRPNSVYSKKELNNVAKVLNSTNIAKFAERKKTSKGMCPFYWNEYREQILVGNIIDEGTLQLEGENIEREIKIFEIQLGHKR